MNYLTRPVFEFAIDWADPVNKRFDFDLRKVSVGFGREVIAPLQSHVTQGFDVALQVATNEAIKAYDDFTAALTGRLVGCWFPAPFEAMKIASVGGGTTPTTTAVVAETANVNLAATVFYGLAVNYRTIDSYASVQFVDPVLLKHQNNPVENGIYQLVITGGFISFPAPGFNYQWVRISGINFNNAVVSVAHGTLNGGKNFSQTTPSPVVGTSSLVFVEAAAPGTQFDILDQNLRSTWADHPDVHLFFLKDGQTSVPAKILSVVLSGSVERVTIDTVVSFLDTSTIVRRLHYVRLADDLERATCHAEGWQQRDVRVIELPTEYATIETGEKKIFLYHFWCAPPAGVDWYYTSFAAPVYSGNKLHSSYAITHRGRRNGVAGDDSLDIEAAWDANHPLALFFPIPISAPMWLQVSETTYGDPDTVTALFTGRVGPPRDAGEKLTARIESFGALLKRKAPRGMIQPGCNNQLFDVNCKVATGPHQVAATIVTINSNTYPPTLVVTIAGNNATRQAADYFAQGWIESGGGTGFEIRTVLASSYNAGNSRYTITLNLGLQHAAVGASIILTPGCDGTPETCAAKFSNLINFFGFRAIPKQNPSLTSVDGAVAEGNKK